MSKEETELNQAQKAEMLALMDMKNSGEELSEEQEIKLKTFEGLKTFQSAEKEPIQINKSYEFDTKQKKILKPKGESEAQA